MDERFGDWLRDVMADLDDGRLKRRWSGVESLASSLKSSEFFHLLLYATNCQTNHEETLAKVRTAFWEHDNAFRMEGNDLELRRLCGTVVIHYMCNEERMDLSLACECLHFAASGQDFGWTPMLEEAQRTLQYLSARVRSEDINKIESSGTMVPRRLLTGVKELLDQGHDHVPLSDLHDVLSQFVKGLKSNC